MKHPLRTLCLLALLALLAASCSYKPDGDFYRDLTPTPPSQQQLWITGYTDTIVATSHTSFTVETNFGGRDLVYYRYYLDGVEIEAHAVYGNSFSIDPIAHLQEDKVCLLTVEVGVGSGTGSIGDALGAEGYAYSRDFILVSFCNTPTVYPEIHCTPAGGKMTLTVDLPATPNFTQKVVLSKYIGGGEPYVFATLSGSQHFTAVDSTYVGEGLSYRCQAYVGDPAGNIFVPMGDSYEYLNQDVPVVSTSPGPSGFPVVHWHKSKFTLSTGGYRVYAQHGWPSNPELIGSVDNVNDTTFPVTGASFPAWYEFRVAPVPKMIPPYYTDDAAWNYFSGSTSGYIGAPSFQFNRCLVPDGNYLYFSQSSNDIKEYSLESNTVTDSIYTISGWFYTMAVSPNAKYLLAANGVSDFQYLFYNLTTHQVTWVPSSQVIGNGAPTGIVSISDNGVAAISTLSRVVVYDFINQSQVTQKVMNQQVSRVVISADAQYVFAEAGYVYLYLVASGVLQQLWCSSTLTGNLTYYNFFPSDPSQALLLMGQTFQVRQCPLFSLVTSYSTDMTLFHNVDFMNGHILGSNGTEIKVYDLGSGAVVYHNPIGENIYDNSLRLKKNTLFYSGGKKLIIF